jgi:hypothetical protein
LITRKCLAVVLTEAAVGLQVQESTAEVPGSESNLDRTCLGIDLRLLSLPLSHNRSRLWDNRIIDHRAAGSRRRSHVCVRDIPRRRRRIRGVNGVGRGHQSVPPRAPMPHMSKRPGAWDVKGPVRELSPSRGSRNPFGLRRARCAHPFGRARWGALVTREGTRSARYRNHSVKV